MSAFWQALLAAQQAQPLVQQFVHDSRKDLIKYSAGWQYHPNAGSPFRNGDVVASSGQPQDIEFSFSFTSAGRADEWLRVTGALDARCTYKVYLNGVLVAERNTIAGDVAYTPLVLFQGGGNFYYGSGNFYENPFLEVQPKSGVNVLKIIKLGVADNDSRSLYFDGIGLHVRGGPLP